MRALKPEEIDFVAGGNGTPPPPPPPPPLTTQPGTIQTSGSNPFGPNGQGTTPIVVYESEVPDGPNPFKKP
jgi:hypothetical protein